MEILTFVEYEQKTKIPRQRRFESTEYIYNEPQTKTREKPTSIYLFWCMLSVRWNRQSMSYQQSYNQTFKTV